MAGLEENGARDRAIQGSGYGCGRAVYPENCAGVNRCEPLSSRWPPRQAKRRGGRGGGFVRVVSLLFLSLARLVCHRYRGHGGIGVWLFACFRVGRESARTSCCERVPAAAVAGVPGAVAFPRLWRRSRAHNGHCGSAGTHASFTAPVPRATAPFVSPRAAPRHPLAPNVRSFNGTVAAASERAREREPLRWARSKVAESECVWPTRKIDMLREAERGGAPYFSIPIASLCGECWECSNQASLYRVCAMRDVLGQQRGRTVAVP